MSPRERERARERAHERVEKRREERRKASGVVRVRFNDAREREIEGLQEEVNILAIETVDIASVELFDFTHYLIGIRHDFLPG